jgi:hypothetical protein
VQHDLVVTLPPVVLGVALYFALAWLLRIEETRQAARLLSRLGRRLAGRR